MLCVWTCGRLENQAGGKAHTYACRVFNRAHDLTTSTSPRYPAARAQSIRSYFSGDDDFNWNFGLALAAGGKFVEAEAVLASISSLDYRWGRRGSGAGWVAYFHLSTHYAYIVQPGVQERGLAAGGWRRELGWVRELQLPAGSAPLMQDPSHTYGPGRRRLTCRGLRAAS